MFSFVSLDTDQFYNLDLQYYLINEIKLFGFLQTVSIQDHPGVIFNLFLSSQNLLQCITHLLQDLFMLTR